MCNPDAAKELIDEMEHSISQLRSFPHIGSELTDSYLASKEYRKLVFYLINEAQQEAIIMRVLYGAR